MGFVKQDSLLRHAYTESGTRIDGLKRSGIVTDTVIELRVDGNYNKDMTYGAYITLHGDPSDATNGEDTLGDKAMLYLQHNKVGRLEIGNTPSAAGLLEMDTVNLGRGTYGIEGYWSQWVVQRTHRVTEMLDGVGMPVPATRGFEFITSPNLFSNYSGHYYSDAPKVNFFTKPLPELTIGVGFIPDLDSSGPLAGMSSKDMGPRDKGRAFYPRTVRNIINAGFMYEGKIDDDWSFKTGIAAEKGDTKIKAYKDLRAYEAGLMVQYKDVKVGGTYGSWFDTMSLKKRLENTKQSSYYYTLGVSHQITKKLGYSLGYMQSGKAGGLEPIVTVNEGLELLAGGGGFSDPKQNKFRNIALDVDYKLADGFIPYAGVSHFRFDEATGKSDSGYVTVVGLRILF